MYFLQQQRCPRYVIICFLICFNFPIFSGYPLQTQRPAPLLLGLTKETMLAMKHTCTTLIALSKYLLSEKGYKFVLLGQFQSDPIERRFGWYRQLNGANYFASMKQFLEAEKTIRITCLTKFNKMVMSDIQAVYTEKDEEWLEGEELEDKVKQILECVGGEESVTVNKTDKNLVFYLSGYIAHSQSEKEEV
jgi:hypothetical protein